MFSEPNDCCGRLLVSAACQMDFVFTLASQMAHFGFCVYTGLSNGPFGILCLHWPLKCPIMDFVFTLVSQNGPFWILYLHWPLKWPLLDFVFTLASQMAPFGFCVYTGLSNGPF